MLPIDLESPRSIVRKLGFFIIAISRVCHVFAYFNLYTYRTQIPESRRPIQFISSTYKKPVHGYTVILYSIDNITLLSLHGSGPEGKPKSRVLSLRQLLVCLASTAVAAGGKTP